MKSLLLQERFGNPILAGDKSRNDSVTCRHVFKSQRVSRYIERLPTKFSYLFLYWC